MAEQRDRIDEKLDRLLEDVGYIKAKVEAVADHETRLRSLERWKLPFIGVMSALGIGNFLSQ